MPKIFLSYRRQDSAAVALWIDERLRAHFGDDAVFVDVDSIPFGVDFRQHIASAIDQCGVLLAVIGRNWLGEPGALRRVDDPRDFVRIEIEAALERNLPVIPVLIDRAPMPGESELPPSLARLAYRNAINVDVGRDFKNHIDRLIRGIEYHLRRLSPATEGPPPQPTTRLESPQSSPPSPAKKRINSVGMSLVRIEPGSFLMGSTKEQIDQLLRLFPDSKQEWFSAEQPQHPVKITRPYYLGIHQITLGQFRSFVEGSGYRTEAEKDGQGGWGWNEQETKFEQNPRFTWLNPGFEQTDEHPVVNVSWNDAVAFCQWLSAREKTEGRTYRLPTEAEWEYACRAGTNALFVISDDPEDLVRIANVADASAKQKFPHWNCVKGNDGFVYTAPVGSFAPNSWGLCDMIGNVWEWCADWYDDKYYASSPAADPPGAAEASYRVLRGGGWNSDARFCRPADRSGDAPESWGSCLGFRVAAVQE
jgi:formylglycine-generating enzyme required for sulfatase activity